MHGWTKFSSSFIHSEKSSSSRVLPFPATLVSFVGCVFLLSFEVVQGLPRIDGPPPGGLDLLPEEAPRPPQYKAAAGHKDSHVRDGDQGIQLGQKLEVCLWGRAVVEALPDLVGIKEQAGVPFQDFRVVALGDKAQVPHRLGDPLGLLLCHGPRTIDGIDTVRGMGLVVGFASQGQNDPRDTQSFLVSDGFGLSVIDQSEKRRPFVEVFPNATPPSFSEIQYVARVGIPLKDTVPQHLVSLYVDERVDGRLGSLVQPQQPQFRGPSAPGQDAFFAGTGSRNAGGSGRGTVPRGAAAGAVRGTFRYGPRRRFSACRRRCGGRSRRRRCF
mmetsp:Transcript_24693/g.54379  ORF Transcript_24693/g.54379 Transcript_24693/m.54379 type:complete len:328 (-) Transcript_24693:57-1040(-)